MPKPQPLTPERLGALTADFKTMVRRHDPEWTGFVSSDPGMTLLELLSWLGDGLSAYHDHVREGSALAPPLAASRPIRPGMTPTRTSSSG